MFTVLGCMLKVIRAQSRSHFVCSRFTRRLYYYRRLLLYVKYKKTSSFNSIFCRRAFICRRNLPNTKENENATSLFGFEEEKNDGNRFLSVIMPSKNFYTLLDQLFYPKRLGMHILSVCLHFVTIASFLKVHYLQHQNRLYLHIGEN